MKVKLKRLLWCLPPLSCYCPLTSLQGSAMSTLRWEVHHLIEAIWNVAQGAACLEELARKGQDFCPGDDFVRQFCPDLVDGVASLVAWVSKLKCHKWSVMESFYLHTSRGFYETWSLPEYSPWDLFSPILSFVFESRSHQYVLHLFLFQQGLSVPHNPPFLGSSTQMHQPILLYREKVFQDTMRASKVLILVLDWGLNDWPRPVKPDIRQMLSGGASLLPSDPLP